jgi:hypothetical protein
MQRKIVYALSASLVVVLMAAAPAFAHQAGPCTPSADDPGHSEFAKHHIVPLAQAGGLGEGGHKPGAHKGFSACDPSGG